MSNSTIIGTTSSFNGVATFQSQPIITSTAPANTDNSTNVATTAWSNSFLTYTKTQANTWSGDQTFGTANVGILNADTIRGVSSTSNMSIGANLNGGSISIGSTTGTTNISGGTAINIGTHTTQTGNIAIGTNNAVLSGTNQIFIGASNKSTNISGTTNILGTVNVSSGTINASNFQLYSTKIGASQSFWMDTIGGTLNQQVIIGYNNASELYLGSPKSSFLVIGGDAGEVKIADTGLSATGRVKIATGTNTTGSEVTIGTTTLTNLFLRANEVKINHQQLKNTYIGSDSGGATALLGNLEVGSNGAGTINLYRPISPQYPLSFTSGQIGYSVKYSWGNSYVNQGEWKTVADFTNQPIGMYLLTIGPVVLYDHGTDKRIDVNFNPNTNINYLTVGSSGLMELGGNVQTKTGFGMSLPLTITSGTNQLTVRLLAGTGPFSCLGSASSLLRIA